MPTTRANSTYRVRRRTGPIATTPLAILAPRASTIHCSTPCVKTTVYVAGRQIIIEAVGYRFVVPVVQIFSHPCLRADLDSLISPTITIVGHGTLNYS